MLKLRNVTMGLLCGMLLAVAAGCVSGSRHAPVYNAQDPGPWKDVLVLTPFEDNKMTVEVRNFPASPTNYVRKFQLWDQHGLSAGQRTFAPEDPPKETFILEPETKQVTVTVISTGQGEWHSKPVPVPEPPVKKPTITPPS